MFMSVTAIKAQTLTKDAVLVGGDGDRITLGAPASVDAHKLLLPGTLGVANSLLYITSVGGSTVSTSWISPGSNGDVLAYIGGSLTWTPVASLPALTFWSLLGNSNVIVDGTNNLLGTTTAAPVRIISGSGGPNTRILVGATGDVTVNGTAGTANLSATSLGSATGTTGRVMFATDATGTLNALATPASNGQILTSTTGGVLSWTSSPTLNFWGLSGNAATTAGTNFLGTTDDVAFEIHVDEAGTSTEGRRRVMRFEPNATSANIIGGFSSNGLGLGTTAAGVTITGGGSNGLGNRASDNFGFVGGGAFNRAGSNDATVTNAQYATVVGGLSNNASGSESFLGGGNGNTASGSQSSLVGGGGSTASGANSAIGGGGTNVASGQYSAISGGSTNTASGVASAVLGGTSNTAGGDYTSVAGGRGLTLSAAGSFGFLGNNGAGANNATVTSANTAYLGNVDLWLWSNDGTGRQMRFYESQATNGAFPTAGTNYTAFQAGSLSDNLIYTLPSNTPGVNSILYSSGGTSSTLSWSGTGADGQVMTLIAGVPTWSSSPTLNFWDLTGNGHTVTDNTNNLLGTTTAAPLRLITGGAGNTRVHITATGDVGIGTTPTSGRLLHVNGTSGTTNVRLTSLASTTGTAFSLANDGIVVADAATGDLKRYPANTVVGSLGWTILGNASTVAGTNFLGTTDAQDLVFKTVGAENMRILQNGRIGVGTSTPVTFINFQRLAPTDESDDNVRITSYGGFNPVYEAATARGTIGAPTRLLAGDLIGSFEGLAWDGSTFSDVLRMVGRVPKNHSASSIATQLMFQTSMLTSVRTQLLIDTNGFTGFGHDFLTPSQRIDVRNGDILLSSSADTNRAGRIRFEEAGALVGDHYVSLEAPDLAATTNYVLPNAYPTTTGQYLTSTTGGTMSWSGNAIGILFARRTTDAALTTATLANDASLVLALSAGAVYEFEADIAYDASLTTCDLKLAFTIPVGATMRWGIVGGNGGSYSPSSVTTSGTPITGIRVSSTAGNDIHVYIKGIVAVNGTAGNLQLQTAQTTASGTTNVLTNSFIKATRVQ